MKQSYEQRVRALAEKCCSTMPMFNSSNLKWDDLQPKAKELHISAFLPAARIAVAEMAEAVEKVWFKCSKSPEWVDEYLKEQGLIPDNGQEAGSDEN